ncbi:hypothetical protein QAC87_13875 [Staphylococcus aureus]|uniref:hypothetical protein n=1 Tax=Staphylococcus aureus TaxID=1280 RepID=UPI00024C322C|nr:hypothetical protein [Staphylococcus aureus]EHQ69895.1 hypothetical protein SA21343_1989 [Staphylococcus aureus subsp. aureus 21343]ELK7322071.1 hypothetical protein [Staphylococcus aureus]MBK4021945.1 hypothetical protein [Staphylococcus aureus]MDI1992536.1 hypothetical protein [Staphylococcus aureus]MDI2003163.1 hypothetical protein [Staphylococcus aureus]
MEHGSKEYYEKQSEYWFDEASKFLKQRDELIGDIGKLRERNKDLEKKASAWDRYCKSVEKDLINEFGKNDERVKFGMELNNKIFMEDDTNE